MNLIATWIFEIVYSFLPLLFIVLLQAATGQAVQLTGTEFYIASLILSINTSTALLSEIGKPNSRLTLKRFLPAMTIYSFQGGTLILQSSWRSVLSARLHLRPASQLRSS